MPTPAFEPLTGFIPVADPAVFGVEGGRRGGSADWISSSLPSRFRPSPAERGGLLRPMQVESFRWRRKTSALAV